MAPVSPLFLPTDRTGVEGPQDQLRIQRLIRQAESLLRGKAQLHSAQVEVLLEPLRALLDDKRFWRHASDGLAIFRSPQVFRAFRLPSSFKEQVVVGDHFSLRPLLPLLTFDGRFYVLALSHHAVRLLACTHDSASEVKLPEQCLPVSSSSSGVRSVQTNSNLIALRRLEQWAKAGDTPPFSTGKGLGLMMRRMTCCATFSTSIEGCMTC